MDEHWVCQYVVYLVDCNGEETDFAREVVFAPGESELVAKAASFDSILREFSDRAKAEQVADDDGLDDDFAITIGLLRFGSYKNGVN